MASCLGCCFGNTSTDKHRSTDKIDGGSTLPALQPVSSPHHAPVIGQTESSSVVQDKENQDGGSTLPAFQQYTYEQLAWATGQFSNNFLLGEGAFGQVYKGNLDGKVVAIKKLKIIQDEQHENLQTKLDEIEVISHVTHLHIVKLLGYCNEEANKLLVLEYVPNKSLKSHLHGKRLLEWKDRMNIAIGAAKGLQYLHEDCDPKIIHRDIKSDNILIGNEFEAKIADFSLAKILPITDDITHITTMLRGTNIYADPEYDPLQRVSEKSDVYSYGVVLLELITGRKPQDAHSNIIEWARLRIVSALSGGIYHALVDSKLDSKLASYETKEMERMISCAAASVYKSSKLRPRMKDIIGVLNGTTPPEQIWNSEDNAFLSEKGKRRAARPWLT
ncbi:proline-rich receptor-like protein kinase PERK15 isoform X2 [Hevea brasiliensis]|uniref:proline-rich receptor-like protein kinase PERK15 isoform X2 n=1 Tax=Hevea brasiliensis TaxID=3981 RepID=UPI0025E79A9A|nr:proline-rich receptor-like protein kinase PERK15 isoform X2 [Hevea brasiliensis]